MIEKKKLYNYTEVSTSGLTDKIPTKQGVSMGVTTLQKIYNLFKTGFDAVYRTAGQVTAAINAALVNYYTIEQIDEAQLPKIDISTPFEFDISGAYDLQITGTSGLIILTGIQGGAQNELFSFENPNVGNHDVYLITIKSASATVITPQHYSVIAGTLTVRFHKAGAMSEDIYISYLKINKD